MQQPLRLALDGGHDVGMAVAGGGHGDAGREVEEPVAVHVHHDLPDGVVDHQRVVLAVVLRHRARVALDDRARPRPGQRADQLGIVAHRLLFGRASRPAAGAEDRTKRLSGTRSRSRRPGSPAISSSSSSVTTRGGANITTSPSVPVAQPALGYTMSPAAKARAATVSARFSARGKGRRVRASATSSTPSRSPRPRTSPTCGRARRPWRRASARSPIAAGALDEALPLQDVEGGQAGGRGHRMVGEREAVHEPARALHRLHDRLAGQHRAHRHVAAAHPLAAGDEVGDGAAPLDAEPAAGAAEAGHDLVVDVDDPMAAAGLAHAPGVVVGGHGRPGGGAQDGLGDEGGDRARPFARDRPSRGRPRRPARTTGYSRPSGQ